MSTSASARLAEIDPSASPATTCWKNCCTPLVPQVGGSDSLVLRELAALAGQGDVADLEDVGAVRDVERDRRVLLHDEEGHAVLAVEPAHEVEERLDDHRREPERRL